MSLAARSVVHHIDAEEQREWVAEVRRVLRHAPLVQPHTPRGLPMRVRVSSAGDLGWRGGADGGYFYSSTQRPFLLWGEGSGNRWPPIPGRWVELANLVAGEHPWDCAGINWYEPGAGLGWHQDQAEADCSLPIVTVSLGDACSWAMRLDEHSPVSRVRLESGDVTLLAGSTRPALHTVERIIAAPLFSPLAARGRVSVTLRVAGGSR